jgi:hypothetical protein
VDALTFSRRGLGQTSVGLALALALALALPLTGLVCRLFLALRLIIYAPGVLEWVHAKLAQCDLGLAIPEQLQPRALNALKSVAAAISIRLLVILILAAPAYLLGFPRSLLLAALGKIRFHFRAWG